MKRARSLLLSLAGLILLGSVLLWVGTRGTGYWWATKSLPGGRGLKVNVGGGHIDFNFVKPNMGIYPFKEGFGSYSFDGGVLEMMDEDPAFYWDTRFPGYVNSWCPTWFPGTLLGGLLLGWGLLCGRDGE